MKDKFRIVLYFVSSHNNMPLYKVQRRRWLTWWYIQSEPLTYTEAQKLIDELKRVDAV